jgi:tripartite-type tricarboxylate transporter receptor subunit TctC
VYYEHLAGLKFQFVPYRGAAPALQDLIAGRIDVLFDHLPNALPQVRDGKVKAYAVTANTRSPSAPDIPTVDEAGVAGLYINIWYGLWVPKGTPAGSQSQAQCSRPANTRRPKGTAAAL